MAHGPRDRAKCRSRAIQEAAEELAELGIELWYLPPYAPERNDIERTFRDTKHQALPVRTYPTAQRLITAIHCQAEQASLGSPANPKGLLGAMDVLS